MTKLSTGMSPQQKNHWLSLQFPVGYSLQTRFVSETKEMGIKYEFCR